MAVFGEKRSVDQIYLLTYLRGYLSNSIKTLLY